MREVELGCVMRMEVVSWRCWTLRTRQRTGEATVGRVLVCGWPKLGAGRLCGIVMEGFSDFFFAEIVVGEPVMDARMDCSWMCVPGPAM